MIQACFGDYRPLFTEVSGLKDVIIGAGKMFLFSNNDPHLALELGPVVLDKCFRDLKKTERGLNEFKRGVKLLGNSPVTYVALTCLAYDSTFFQACLGVAVLTKTMHCLQKTAEEPKDCQLNRVVVHK